MPVVALRLRAALGPTAALAGGRRRQAADGAGAPAYRTQQPAPAG